MLNSVAQTYELANDPEGKQYLVTDSELIGEEVSRFVKFYMSPEDLLKTWLFGRRLISSSFLSIAPLRVSQYTVWEFRDAL
ncbi:MAG: hypothetical protein HWN71_09210 [Desulfobacterales bacterium]|nr:hypothetical protein [Desulfobacterales bacterium]